MNFATALNNHPEHLELRVRGGRKQLRRESRGTAVFQNGAEVGGGSGHHEMGQREEDHWLHPAAKAVQGGPAGLHTAYSVRGGTTKKLTL